MIVIGRITPDIVIKEWNDYKITININFEKRHEIRRKYGEDGILSPEIIRRLSASKLHELYAELMILKSIKYDTE